VADENTGRRPGLSRSQIDRIGDRLRKRQLDPSTLTELDEYRRSFEPAYEEVVRRIQLKLGVTPTGRAGKSIPSIIEKLERESIRLSQMQDIAGCRIVCADIPEQDRVVAETESLFDDATIIDRRVRPSYGYRAVHVVVRISKFPVEIQVRTVIQHLWAELLRDHVRRGRQEPQVRRRAREL